MNDWSKYCGFINDILGGFTRRYDNVSCFLSISGDFINFHIRGRRYHIPVSMTFEETFNLMADVS